MHACTQTNNACHIHYKQLTTDIVSKETQVQRDGEQDWQRPVLLLLRLQQLQERSSVIVLRIILTSTVSNCHKPISDSSDSQ